MLSPYNYRTDCRQVTGKVIKHVSKSTQELIDGRQKAEVLWRKNYENEPFDVLVTPSSQQVSSQSQPPQLITYDLLAATQRQAKFYYNVSLPHYRDERFLESSVRRYRKFLYLKRRHKDAYIVPCYDIDLVWHTHQVHPLTYRKDTVEILGRMLNHDDTTDDRTPGSYLQQSFAKTKQLWISEYKEAYSVSGAMYRGISPAGEMPSRSSARNAIKSSKLRQKLEQLQVSAESGWEKIELQLKAGRFKNFTIPNDVELPWGPFEMDKLPDGTENTCEVASHRLVIWKDDG
jgi:hypothetical protein